MYEGLRLTELHEEAGWLVESLRRANLEKRGIDAAKTAGKLLAYEAEIRARVAAQAIIEDRLPKAMIPTGLVVPLRHGIPDAARKYPGRYDHWSYHARHAVPVEGCHLCQAGRKISAAIREAL